MPKEKLKQEVETSWNSTYDMIHRFEKNKAPILSTLALLDQHEERNLNKDDWEIMDGIIKYLIIFKSITEEISSEKTISISKVPLLTRFLVKQCLEDKSRPHSLKEMC
ncbi:hypothetical protein AVEN_183818-1 [Araneus ventricosus]|uniref:Zinc finger BED domain-containing protein 4 n=1 Tax=Araneus ventricosus TaxID=182803 RepID=A0A4Y2N6C7_ARAVE|nr:hypothetical protein AVEN_183818-1 [Araneus ventricosus]